MGWGTTAGSGELVIDGDLRITVSTPMTAFHAYRTTAHSLYANSLHVLPWDALLTAVNSGAFNANSGAFIAPDSGTYHVGGGVTFTNVVSGNDLSLTLRKNGASFIQRRVALVNSMAAFTLDVSVPMTLVQSDYLQLSAQALLAGAQAGSGSLNSWFTGARVR